AVCRDKFSLEPFDGTLIVFRNRAATAIKIIAYDGGGFWLLHKRFIGYSALQVHNPAIAYFVPIVVGKFVALSWRKNCFINFIILCLRLVALLQVLLFTLLLLHCPCPRVNELFPLKVRPRQRCSPLLINICCHLRYGT